MHHFHFSNIFLCLLIIYTLRYHKILNRSICICFSHVQLGHLYSFLACNMISLPPGGGRVFPIKDTSTILQGREQWAGLLITFYIHGSTRCVYYLMFVCYVCFLRSVLLFLGSPFFSLTILINQMNTHINIHMLKTAHDTRRHRSVPFLNFVPLTYTSHKESLSVFF